MKNINLRPLIKEVIEIVIIIIIGTAIHIVINYGPSSYLTLLNKISDLFYWVIVSLVDM